MDTENRHEHSEFAESARSGEQNRQSARFVRATIDALSQHIAVIDEMGVILLANSAWRHFASENGIAPSTVSEGANYLEVCDSAAAGGDKDAAEVAARVRAVLAGESDSSAWEYCCHAPDEERWFVVKITRFWGEGPVRVVVAHENLTQRHQDQARIVFLATHDPLTNLPNRNLFTECAEDAIRQADSRGSELALLFLDLDGFKFVNDAYGHIVGDDALKAFARGLREQIGRRGTLARFGGDEFVILLNGLENASSAALEVAKDILAHFSQPLTLQDRELTVTTSIGITLYPSHGRNLNQLLANGDAAMYSAKELGRNGFQFYSAEMGARASERMLIASELRRGLRAAQFELHYQPQVCLATGQVAGLEALIRWAHPTMGLIPPDRFIPVAEEAGLINPIGRWVLETACAQNAAWQSAGLPALPVAVNVAAQQIWDTDFVDHLQNALSQAGLEPQWLQLEITERVVMERTHDTMERLAELKALGIHLCIDDFGTGFSNLGYLQSFAIDWLKIDRSFVAGLPRDTKAVAITRAIVALGRNLGIKVVAEGVETPEQDDFLRAAGCELAQGHYYSVPLTPEKMEEWLREKMPQGVPKSRSASVA